MNVFAKFDEIPSMTLQDIKETKRYGHTFICSDGRTDGRTDNVKTVYPPTNTVCGWYKNMYVGTKYQVYALLSMWYPIKRLANRDSSNQYLE